MTTNRRILVKHFIAPLVLLCVTVAFVARVDGDSQVSLKNWEVEEDAYEIEEKGDQFPNYDSFFGSSTNLLYPSNYSCLQLASCQQFCCHLKPERDDVDLTILYCRLKIALY